MSLMAMASQGQHLTASICTVRDNKSGLFLITYPATWQMLLEPSKQPFYESLRRYIWHCLTPCAALGCNSIGIKYACSGRSLSLDPVEFYGRGVGLCLPILVVVLEIMREAWKQQPNQPMGATGFWKWEWVASSLALFHISGVFSWEVILKLACHPQGMSWLNNSLLCKS